MHLIFLEVFLIAFLAAFVGGIVGIGGALISLPTYLIFFHNNFEEASLYTFIGMAFLTIISVIKYSRQKTPLPFKKVMPSLLGLSLGLILSNMYIQPFMHEHHLSKSIGLNIALITILFVVSMVIIFKNKLKVFYINEIFLFPIGLVAAISSSILGIGTSSVFLPVLLFLYGMNAKQIPIITLFLMSMIAFVSIFERLVVLQIQISEPWAVAFIGIGSIIGGILGPIINKKINVKYVLWLNVAVRFLAIITTTVSMILV